MTAKTERLVARVRELDLQAPKEKARIADERAKVVAELAELVGVIPAAELLGVTRAAIYKSVNRARRTR